MSEWNFERILKRVLRDVNLTQNSLHDSTFLKILFKQLSKFSKKILFKILSNLKILFKRLSNLSLKISEYSLQDPPQNYL